MKTKGGRGVGRRRMDRGDEEAEVLRVNWGGG